MIKARELCSGKKVAIKFVEDPHEGEAEIRALEIVNDSPNIIKLLSSFALDPDKHYTKALVFPWCKRTARGFRLLYDHCYIATFMYQLLQAVRHCHMRSIIHRDIKPSNILLSNNLLNKLTVVLADFGLAVHKSPDLDLNDICGTFGYMAPEVAAGESYEFAADIWSVGIVFYELLAGSLPVNSQITITLPPNISADEGDFLQFLLQSTPTKRPTATEALMHKYFNRREKQKPQK